MKKVIVVLICAAIVGVFGVFLWQHSHSTRAAQSPTPGVKTKAYSSGGYTWYMGTAANGSNFPDGKIVVRPLTNQPAK